MSRPRRGFWSVIALSAGVPFLGTGAALGDVDLEVRPGDSVRGTLSPAAESERIRIYLPASGARMSLKAKAARGGPVLRVTTADFEDDLVFTGAGTKVASAKQAYDGPGEAQVLVTSEDGAATGDYSIRIVTRVPKRESRNVTVPPAGAAVVVGAEAGMRIAVTAESADADADFRFGEVSGPGGFLLDAGSAEPGGAADSVAPFTAPTAGEYAFGILSGAAADTEVALTITRTRSKAKPRKIDVRSSVIGGGQGGEESAVAAVIGGEGGSVVVPDLGLAGGLDDVSGAGVTFPAGALAFPTTVVVASAASLGVDDSIGSLGPAVFFGPEGTDFGVAARVTIPFDASLVGGDTADVAVYVRDAKGRVTRVTLDAQSFSTPGYVSFPATHFSSYQAFAAPGVPLPNPLTVAAVSGAVDAAPTQQSGATTRPSIYTADGTARTVTKLTFAGASPIAAATRFAGGGSSAADGTDRLDFQFPGDVTAVATRVDTDEVYVGAGAAVYRIGADGAVTRVAGTGASGDAGDNGPAVAAQVRGVDDLLVDNLGNLFVADRASARIRFVLSGGNIVTEYGTGASALGADTDPASTTMLLAPRAISHSNGSLVVGDGARVRRLNRGTNVNQTLAGDAAGGTGTFSAPVTATLALFTTISAVHHDQPRNRILVSDSGAHVVVAIDLSQAPPVASVVAGVPGFAGASADDSAAPFLISAPRAVLSGGAADIVVFLESDGRLRMFDFVP
ncbi:MAG: hypothetical protein HMLKMBBP_03148 [Planctomycetes bacterium]|nr:hypothetical protein [Planctomycetota bacterium]